MGAAASADHLREPRAAPEARQVALEARAEPAEAQAEPVEPAEARAEPAEAAPAARVLERFVAGEMPRGAAEDVLLMQYYGDPLMQTMEEQFERHLRGLSKSRAARVQAMLWRQDREAARVFAAIRKSKSWRL